MVDLALWTAGKGPKVGDTDKTESIHIVFDFHDRANHSEMAGICADWCIVVCSRCRRFYGESVVEVGIKRSRYIQYSTFLTV